MYADVIRRYHQLLNQEVLYLCGADENALKIFQAAEKSGQTPQAFTDLHNQEFLEVAKQLNVHFDIWQRGSDQKNHFPSSQKLWELCQKNGDIYKKSYTGLYCVGCEMFYTEDELNEKGECFEHPGRKLDKVSEENYFFKLSRYQTFLEDLLVHDKLKVIPDIRKNEALAFVQRGLPDFSISRSRERARGWGIPVPGDESQIMYVWFDALNIYQTGIGFHGDETTYRKWSPQDVMVIGKGIIRFLTVDGQKMSKTIGNVVDPIEVIQKYGTDATRYYLLREIPSTADGDYSQRRFKELYNADLANGLGNLVARISRLAEKVTLTPPLTEEFQADYKNLLNSFQFDLALAWIWEKIKITDKFINDNEPWKITDQKKLTEVLQKAVNEIGEIAFHLQPFLPDTAEKILTQFSGSQIKSQPPLFPRLS
ncbi:MAG: Methionine-tRNA ligase [Candidatus Gottesmanbacteria bacterium GW2011_GWA1_42_26]|nr:MAG: Methionine-tRNA ligase [Candidatus Gottesmanbacteria bacterium GW2011_GWA1_42_26]